MGAEKRSKTPLARRLKETAKASGYTAEALSERLGTAPSTIWAWWSGRNEPPIEALVRYAREVRRSLECLATGCEEGETPADGLAEWVMAFADRLSSGEEPEAAFAEVTGRPEILTARERRSLSRRAQGMRAMVSRVAGRPWGELSPEERREALNLFIARIEVTVTKVPGRKVHERQVTAIEVQPWLAPFVPAWSPEG